MDDETITNYPEGKKGADSSSGKTVFSGTFGEQDFSGSTLGHYQIVRKLAEGGMGVVYEAIQTKLDRKVALKVLTNNLSDRPEFLKRFEREAKAAAALNHSNLVQVYDFGEASGRHYLVMEFIEGEDLAQHIQHYGKMNIPDGLNAIEQAAHALKAACAKSIIHRDIKPSNLMLTRDGIVKVSDLGLAKILTENTEVTATGVGMGSPHFIAPEQADDSRNVDHRVDIYALGITLLYLLTGKKPFDGSSPFSVVLAHVNKPLPSGRDLGTDLPESVEWLINRMAAKKPEHRYQDYQSLIDDIKRVREGEGIAAPIAPTPVPPPSPEQAAGRKTEIFSDSFQFGNQMSGATAPTQTASSVPTATQFPTTTNMGMRPALMASAVGAVAAIVVIGVIGLFFFFNSRKPVETPAQTAVAIAAPDQVQQAPAEPVDARGDERRDEGPGPNDEFADERGDPSRDGGPDFHISRLLGTLEEIRDPLADGPVDEMFATAKKYAADNPRNHRDILARFEQVQAKAAGSDLESTVSETVQQWRTQRDTLAEKAFVQLQARVKEVKETRGHHEAMDQIRTFPVQLRSREMDIRILHDVASPPPEGERGPDGGARRPPRRGPGPAPR